jgi:hypothetical protein
MTARLAFAARAEWNGSMRIASPVARKNQSFSGSRWFTVGLRWVSLLLGDRAYRLESVTRANFLLVLIR